MKTLKAFLLKELHLSPAVYLEKFNSLTQDKSETYTQFSTRLMSLFDYYLESRKISQSYDKLIDLMVCDRVKSCLSLALSRYVLSLEANHKEGWIGRQGLAEALYSYLANLPESSGRSRFVPVPQAKTGSKPDNGKRETHPGNVMPERFSARSGSLYTDSQGQKPVPAPRPVPRRCYLCNSPTHLASDYPQNSSSRGFTPKPVPRPKVNFCRTKQKLIRQNNQRGARVTRDRSAGGSADPTCSNCNPVSGAGVQYESSCQSSAANVVAPKCDSAVNHMQLVEETTWIGTSQDHVKPSCDDGLRRSHIDTELPSDEILQDGCFV